MVLMNCLSNGRPFVSRWERFQMEEEKCEQREEFGQKEKFEGWGRILVVRINHHVEKIAKWQIRIFKELKISEISRL